MILPLSIKNFLSTIIFVLGITTVTLASHFSGASLTYEYIGPNQYLLKLEIYRDCEGISAEATQVVNYSSISCGVDASLTVNLQSTTDITPLCPSASSSCNGGNGSVGIEHLVYTGILNLPPGCTDWIISTGSCCRNSSITNLSNPSSESIYVETHLNNSSGLYNTSPEFSNVPQFFGCVGQTINFQQLAYDVDGDSLSYSLVNGMQTSNTNVTYAGGFSGTNPFTVPITIDSQTGQITFTPNVPQVAVVVVRIDEYRNGVLIGSIMRDIQFIIQSCTNTIPEISGINGTPGLYDITVCAGAEVCFDILGSDVDPGQNVTLTYSNNISGAVFTSTGTGINPSGTFCWNTTINDQGTYSFTINAEDDACPLIGQNSAIYTVNVIPNPHPPVDAGPDVNICEGEIVTLNATSSSNPSVISSYSWNPSISLTNPNSSTTDASPSSTTSYTSTLTYTDGCISQDVVTIIVNEDPISSVFPSNSDVCGGANFQLTGTTNQSGMTFEWFDPSMGGLGSGVVNGTSSTISVTVPNTPGIYTYTLVVINPVSGCSTSSTAALTVGAPPAIPNCINIYVSTTGSTSAPGTQAAPTTLVEALNRAACNNTVIKLATGTYNIDNALTIGSYVTIEGGFMQGSGWTKTSQAGATTINRTTANPEGAANSQRLVAFYGNSVTGFRFQDITISTSNANQSGMSTYGVHLTNCSNYDFVRTQILSGSGGNGNGDNDPATYNAAWDGANGTNGGNGGTGAAGQCRCNITGTDQGGNGGAGGAAGTGGASATGIVPNGGDGSNGGDGGRGRNENQGGPGDVGTAGNGTNPGAGGVGGAADSNGNDTPYGGTGGTGGVGTAGTNGVTVASSFTGGFYIPSFGTDGTGGSGGSGGGGAGGAGRDVDGCDAAGGGGSGGGGGGGGGGAGKGASGGGSSFALYLFNNGNNGRITDCFVSAGTPGLGGIGGSGGNGGNGGTSANGSGCSDGDANRGGRGGNGGVGGNGGDGGDGGDGISANIQLDGGSALTTNISTFNLSAQPVILASNVNCTNTDVQYTANTLPQGVPGAGVGVANWNFDNYSNNATPATGINNPDITQYTSIGRYTVSQGPQVYEGFQNIAFSNSILPEINSNAPVFAQDTFILCQGDFATFESVYYADTYEWNFNGAIPDPGNVQIVNSQQFNTPGFYPITLLTTTDCCGTGPLVTVYLQVVPSPTATGSGGAVICSGESTILSLSGLTATDSVIWSPTTNLTYLSSSSVSVNPSVTTNYIATIYSKVLLGNQTVLSCPITINFPVTVYPTPELSISSSDVTCTNNGTATVTVINPSGVYDFVWSNSSTTLASTTSTITGLSVGSYTVSVTNTTSSCSIDSSIIVFPAPTLPYIYVQTLTPNCEGNTDGSVTLNVSGGTAPISYSWNDGYAGATRSNLSGGTFTVTATDNNGCFSSVTFEIPEYETPHVHVHAESTVCYGDSVVFEIEGHDGSVLTYNFGGADQYIDFTDDTMYVTLYNLTSDTTMHLVSVSNGQCVNVLNEDVTVNVVPLPTMTLTGNGPICNGDDAQFTVTGPTDATIYYSMGAGALSTTLTGGISIITIPGVTLDQTLYLDSLDDGFCPQPLSDSLTITVNPTYSIIVDTIICENSTYTYPDGTVETITGNTTQLSSLLTINNCDSLITTNIVILPTYNSVTNLNVCQNESVTYPDGVTETITANTSHTSNLVSINNCDSIIVTNITMLPAYSLTDTAAICSGESYTFPDGTTHTNITVDENYTSVFTTVNGCDSIIATTITVNPLPIIDAGIDFSICEGDSITLIATNPNNAAIVWDNGVVDGNSFSPTITQTYHLTATSLDGCISNDSIIVTVNPSYNSIVNLNICENKSITYPDGVTEVITSNTSHTSNLISINNCDSIIVTNITMLPAYSVTNTVAICSGDNYTFLDGTTHTNITIDENYTSIFTTINGCDSTITTMIIVNPLPVINAGSDFSVCEGDSIILTATNPNNATLAWDNGVTNGIGFIPSSTQTYTVVATNTNGCISSDDITITVNLNPNALFSADTLFGCAPLKVNFENLSTGSPVSCVWNFGDGQSINDCGSTSHIYTTSGEQTVTLTVTDVNGCSSSITRVDYIEVFDQPIADFNVSSNDIDGWNSTVEFYNTSINGISYVWDFGDEAPSSTQENPIYEYDPNAPGNYVVTLIASNGICQDTVQQVVTLEETIIYYVPNTFTPDGDEFNQTFKPVFTSGFDPYNYQLSIYNRWGELIFDSHDVEFGWDGTYKGKMVPDGTYVWRIVFKQTMNDIYHQDTGHVNMLK